MNCSVTLTFSKFAYALWDSYHIFQEQTNMNSYKQDKQDQLRPVSRTSQRDYILLERKESCSDIGQKEKNRSALRVHKLKFN
jgi:hypothetical protein